MRIAITRALSPEIGRCELSYIDRQPIDVERAERQHEEYERLLQMHGCTIVHAAATPEMADGVFVEDAAVVLDDVAIITRPGAESRRGETESIAAVLKRFRKLRRVEAPGTLDGGDVLAINGKLHIGISQRSNEEAVEQVGANAIRFRGCLHLKSAVTQIAERTLLLNPEWVDARQFPGFETVAVDPREAFGANALRLDDILIYSASYPNTLRRLKSRGFRVETLEVDELEKAEAGVTCCSLIFKSDSVR